MIPDPSPTEGRRQQIRARLEQAVVDLEQSKSDWQQIVNYPTLVEGQQRTIDVLRDALAEVDALSQRLAERTHRRACECEQADPVMQADDKFYCHRCSFETGARPDALEPEAIYRRADAVEAESRRLFKALAELQRHSFYCFGGLVILADDLDEVLAGRSSIPPTTTDSDLSKPAVSPRDLKLPPSDKIGLEG